jgi:ribosomal protein RSM22 (predicted rRNA methylase)
MTALPAWISAALNSKLENVARGSLRERAQAISDTYRAGGTSAGIRNDNDALAYAVVRMPATYAAVHAALTQTVEIIPRFEPRSLLDVGSGPGTASWASLDVWPSMARIALIDSNQRLLDLATDFQHSAGAPPFDLSVLRGNLTDALGKTPKADVVMASYVLTEIAPGALSGVLDQLWSLTERLLVIVEPGTPAGFRRILDCRNALHALDAQILAPCSHEGPCPLANNDRWCHFSARLPRSRDHLLTKGANVPFEDEKFSYLVAGKGFADTARGKRILATPRVSKANIGLTLCAPETPEDYVIARSEKNAYKAAKRLDWGDALNV